MKHSRELLIKKKAAQLLEENGITQAPVNVETVAASLNITIRRTPTEDELSGFLLRKEEGQTVIGVNTNHHPNRQRFTIGHEIGHFVLHRHSDMHVDRVVVKLRSELSSKGEDTEEIEANRFSAELLMPESMLDRDIKKLSSSDLNDDRVIQQLAKRYGVSVNAMTNRLNTLGYISSF